MSLFDPLRPYLRTALALLFLAVAVALFLSGRSCERQASAAEVERLKTRHAQALAASATELARLATDYRNRERAMGDAFIAASGKHSEELRRANVARDRLFADLRAGVVRLQDHWAGFVPAAAGAAADPGGTDPAAERRAAGAADLVWIAAEFDAYAALCHRTLTAERRP